MLVHLKLPPFLQLNNLPAFKSGTLGGRTPYEVVCMVWQ